MKRFLPLCGSLILLGASAFGYGPVGHEMVGAVADARISGTTAQRTVAELLGGVTLARAATLPDEIKSWDKLGPNDAHAIGGFVNPKLTEALWQFVRANPPPEQGSAETPSHHWFHYTDVPVEATSYDSGTAGRSKWDLVQMIPYCVKVLRGEVPENNPRKITKPVALVLLAHYVGDLHQPLHVGAEYFRPDGTSVNADTFPKALEDEGGNTILLKLTTPVRYSSEPTPKLHSFWDSAVVTPALNVLEDQIKADVEKAGARVYPPLSHAQLVHWMAAREPKGWQADAPVDPLKWAKHRADEMLPLARAAHQRLRFANIHPAISHGKPVVRGEAQEIPMPDQKSYVTWASELTAEQLQKGGWRLAELLEGIWK